MIDPSCVVYRSSSCSLKWLSENWEKDKERGSSVKILKGACEIAFRIFLLSLSLRCSQADKRLSLAEFVGLDEGGIATFAFQTFAISGIESGQATGVNKIANVLKTGAVQI